MASVDQHVVESAVLAHGRQQIALEGLGDAGVGREMPQRRNREINVGGVSKLRGLSLFHLARDLRRLPVLLPIFWLVGGDFWCLDGIVPLRLFRSRIFVRWIVWHGSISSTARLAVFVCCALLKH